MAAKGSRIDFMFLAPPLWLIHTPWDRDRDRDREMMGFCIMLYTVHTTQGEGQVHVTIVFYCTHPGPGPCPSPGPVQCEWAITRPVDPLLNNIFGYSKSPFPAR